MKKIIQMILFFTLILSVCTFADDSTVSVSLQTEAKQTDARTMEKLVNEFRTGSANAYYDASGNLVYTKLAALTYDYKLEEIALQRAAEIVVLNGMMRPDGTYYYEVHNDANYKGYTLYECVVAGVKTASDALAYWKADNATYSGQANRRNILAGNISAMAAAHVVYNGVDYWVLELSSMVNNKNTTAPLDKTITTSVKINTGLIKSIKVADFDTDKFLKLKCGEVAAVNATKVGISLADSKGNTTYGKPIVISATVKIEVADSKLVTYDSVNGVIKAIEAGKTSITFTAFGKTDKYDVVIEHNPGEHTSAKAPTCTEEGSTGGVVCKGCNKLVSEGTAIPAKGHTPGEPTEAKDATCTEDGYTSEIKCSACGEVIEAKTVIPAKGHEADEPSEAVEPTCTIDGYTPEVVCKVCGEIITEKGVIPATGHKLVVSAEAVEATCTTDGASSEVSCEVCGEIISESIVIPATGHTEVIDARVEPTAKKTGLTEGSHCSVCGEVLVAQQVIDKITVAAPVWNSIDNTTNGITLRWNKVAKAEGYYVYRNNKLIATIASGKTVRYTDKTAVNGTKYTYTIRAYVGTVKSVKSETRAYCRISTPSAPTVKNVTGKKLNISWAKNAKVTGYQIKIENAGKSQIIVVAGAKNVKTVVESLKKNKTYKISVRGYIKKSGVLYLSAWSSVKSVKITK